jgi:hypothetical protein
VQSRANALYLPVHVRTPPVYDALEYWSVAISSDQVSGAFGPLKGREIGHAVVPFCSSSLAVIGGKGRTDVTERYAAYYTEHRRQLRIRRLSAK